MSSVESVSSVSAELSQTIGLPKDVLIRKSLISFIEKEIRLAEAYIADIRDRYSITSKEELYEAIKSKNIPSHPVWEDYIIWENKENYIADLNMHLGRIQ